MSEPTLGDIGACVFDAYGTLIDFNSAVEGCRDRLGEQADALSAVWRQKQLEYTWLRSLMGRHADFWQVTGEALDFALAATGIEDASLRERLLALYRTLEPYPEVIAALAALKAAGMKTAVLSNGAPDMLAAAVEGAGLAPLLDAVYSVEQVGIFKPHPSVYRIAVDGLGVAPERIAFQSANGWDIAGAAAFGFRAVWINRAKAPAERLPFGPAATLNSLAELPALLGL